jgi:nucleoid DNA-binding protein
MNKSELIKYLVKLSGVSVSESKLFFESVLRIISNSLMHGDSIRLPDGGYFHFRKAKLDTRSALLKDKLFKEKVLDIIIYSPEKDFKKTQRENLIFNVPEPDTVIVNYLDSYFSFSIDKQLIPVNQSDYDSIFIPRTSAELKRFIETKAKKFFDQCESIKEQKTSTQPLVIGSDAVFGNQNEPNWNELTVKNPEDKIDEKGGADNINFESITWDFSSELEKEIKEDEILDFTHDELLNKTIEDEMENLSWDFGLTESSKIFIEDGQSEQTKDEFVPSEIKADEPGKSIEPIETIDLSLDDIEKQIESLSGIVLNEEQVDDTDKFQRVVAAVESEINNESKQNETEPESLTKPESSPDSSGAGQNTYPIDIKEIISQVAEKRGEKKEDDTKKEFLDKKNSIFKEKDFDNKRHSPFWRVFILSILITSLFVYFFIINKTSSSSGSSSQVNESRMVVGAKINVPNLIFERGFEIPITYPYLKGNLLRVAQFNPLSEISFQNETEINETKDSTANSQNANIKSSEIQLREGQEYSSVGRNIFKYPDGFTVQVASYQALNMAEEEARKYINRGENAFVQKVKIKGMGIWYRVNVSGFKTLEEAQRFSNTIANK